MENSVKAPADNLEQYKRYFEDARDANDKQRSEALIDRDYFDGHQWTEGERRQLEARKQPALYFNEVKIAIRGLIGVWEQGETDPRAWPRNPQDEQSADVATKVLRYIKDQTEWVDKRTYCALNFFVEGTTAVHIGVDANNRPQIEQIKYEEFFHDPRSRALDFTDARYMGIGKWMFAEDLAAMYPDQRDGIMSSLDAGITLGTAGDTFADRPEGEGLATEWVDGRLRRVFVAEMYHREGGQWMRCVFWGRGLLDAGPSPYLDKDGKPACAIKARSCYIDRDNRRYGEVRDLRSPQDAVNKRESKLLHLVNNRQVRATDPAMAYPADSDLVRAEAARPDGVIPAGWDIATTNDMASGQMMLLDSARNFIQRIGQNPGVLAAQSASASGRAQIARQQAGMTDSAMTLNGMRKFEHSVYVACWDRARQFWKQPDWIRITDDEEAAQFVGVNQPIQGPAMVGADPATGMPAIVRPVLGYDNPIAELDVDITIDSVPNTATLAMEQFETLASLAQAGVPIPPKALILASSLPDKQKIMELMAPEQPDPAMQMQQQMAQMAGQIAMMQGQADVENTQADTQLKLAKAGEAAVNQQLAPIEAGARLGGAA
ncbi:hypothetical protein UFOVP368_5 [uncultured Caudovirales phage]|uniref:Phage P22-like portal protein n=1 Tax=uncultured Caudovirales phage TaxID=2100421 RepID=A0A6J7WZV7_9CAUD|nr:hypothetical protein UFOVP368_5 [uncultured Caudovirales phage]